MQADPMVCSLKTERAAYNYTDNLGVSAHTGFKPAAIRTTSRIWTDTYDVSDKNLRGCRPN